MKCKYCGCLDSKVIDSRPSEDGLSIRRRRECVACGRRFTTFEKIETTPIFVVKKDGRRELFDSQKLRRGIMRACDKRPVPVQDIDRLVQEVETQVLGSLDQEVSSQLIGELAMQKLRTLDEVAYVRFASVYRQFKDVSSFMEEISRLLKDKNAED